MQQDEYIIPTQNWVDRIVVGLNLCPFAKRELVKDRVRFCVSDATEQAALLVALQTELERLNEQPEIETTLLIHPHALKDFFQYNQFLADANGLLQQLDLEGIYQIASFHPHYQFSGTSADDAENYTNRSPFPMLHLIREEGLEQAIANYSDVDLIPERNIALLNKKGPDAMRNLLNECFDSKHTGPNQPLREV